MLLRETPACTNVRYGIVGPSPQSRTPVATWPLPLRSSGAKLYMPMAGSWLIPCWDETPCAKEAVSQSGSRLDRLLRTYSQPLCSKGKIGESPYCAHLTSCVWCAWNVLTPFITLPESIAQCSRTFARFGSCPDLSTEWVSAVGVRGDSSRVVVLTRGPEAK